MSIPTPTVFWNLDESSGNAADATGGGNTLVNTGSVTYGTGKIGNCAIGTDTTGGYLIISSAFGFTTSSTNTWNFWYKRTTGSSGYMLDHITSSGSSKRLIIYESSGTLRIFANGNEVATSSLTVGTWYMITVTKNNTSWEVFVNGSSIGTTTTGGLTYSGGAGFILLNSLYTGGSKTTSSIDIVGIWGEVLNSTAIGELYNSGTGIQYPFSSSFTPTPMLHHMAISGGLM